MRSHPTLSIVVPIFDEEPVIEVLHRRLVEVLERTGETFEIVLVDDGSRDGSWAGMCAAAARDGRVVLVQLSRNFGHQIAITAGVDAAEGEAVVLIDADLQDPPEVILEMVARWREGYDVVYGRRSRRHGESWFKRATAAGFYRVMRRCTSIDLPLDTGDFRLMSRRVVEALKQCEERNRFVRGLVAWIGWRQTAVHYERAVRLAGETKYPLRKMVRFAGDAIVSFSFAPLRLATTLGLVVSTLSFAYGVYAVLARVFGWGVVQGWASLMVAVVFLGGVQLVSLGIVGEYVGRVYDEVKRRPLYVAEVRRAASGASCGTPDRPALPLPSAMKRQRAG